MWLLPTRKCICCVRCRMYIVTHTQTLLKPLNIHKQISQIHTNTGLQLNEMLRNENYMDASQTTPTRSSFKQKSIYCIRRSTKMSNHLFFHILFPHVHKPFQTPYTNMNQYVHIRCVLCYYTHVPLCQILLNTSVQQDELTKIRNVYAD